MNASRTSIILTSLAYFILSPICFGIFNTVEIYREGVLIYILVLALAFITALFQLILSLLLEKTVTNRFRWTLVQILIGVLFFETISLVFVDSSLLFSFLIDSRWYQFGLIIGNLAALMLAHGFHFLFVYTKK